MFLDLKEIGPEGVPFDSPLEIAPLEGPAGEPMAVESVRLWGNVIRGDRGLELMGSIAATIRLGCSRCLEPFPIRIEERFHLTLVPAMPAPEGRESEVTEQSAALFEIAEGRLDLNQVAAEQIYLDLPLKPVCRAGCRGLCPRCGVDRNFVAECGCPDGDVDPRLTPLLALRDRTPKS